MYILSIGRFKIKKRMQYVGRLESIPPTAARGGRTFQIFSQAVANCSPGLSLKFIPFDPVIQLHELESNFPFKNNFS